ncbi:formyltransferase family protein [Leptospira meyeri]|uniref:Methionyl-tRNA formyltransferase n=1 Tax=Leptospira meyeri TaxID=29508 RepID=A0A4V6QDH1_LEPME|nr:formyltransferase family protein [Leptospira meyeri]EKJ88678.1 formyl transferase domain protein [Leptospira meyeri serovar Hardjo str. Went 5]EMJ87124.1 formyl transferase domain protein [Leptospira meyeri serovar Semaranga str. Veldrot Semarang 173]TDY71181.1 methionyl-tRNA formyltransferase [Leptospira meyeri]TGL52960.1 methionyl-tRNA formyltransferase [Leptospira meyeri]
MKEYIVAAVGKWNRELFECESKLIPGKWKFVDNPESLDLVLADSSPRYIFFPHWRWIVPPRILNQYECICFHMTDVPYGRGGSPLQNLIIRGHKETVLTALRMEKGLDTGPVYMKLPLDLNGSAEEIYTRTSTLTWKMISEFVSNEPRATPQEGEPVIFKRRKPEESELPETLELEKIYDFIRMLDADGYPNAYINFGNYQLKFNQAKYLDGKLSANVEFILKEEL